MNIKNIAHSSTRVLGRNALKFKKNSPHVMFGVGVVGVIGTVVLASRATLRVNDILDEHEENEVKIQRASNEFDDYTEDDAKKDYLKNHVGTALAFAKLYGPAVLVGTTSIACLTGAHVTMHRRNTALMAAYAAVDTAFKAYRERVVNEAGLDKDREYMYGSEEKEVYSETKKGEPKVDRVKVAGGPSQYSVFFSPSNENWEPTPEHNAFFLKAGETYLNHVLQTRGHVTLNDVYDHLGFPRTKAGFVVGWVYDRDLNNTGDNHISFGIWDESRIDRFHEFMSGREDHLLLDFNVDGVIYDQI